MTDPIWLDFVPRLLKHVLGRIFDLRAASSVVIQPVGARLFAQGPFVFDPFVGDGEALSQHRDRKHVAQVDRTEGITDFGLHGTLSGRRGSFPEPLTHSSRLVYSVWKVARRNPQERDELQQV